MSETAFFSHGLFPAAHDHQVKEKCDRVCAVGKVHALEWENVFLAVDPLKINRYQ